MTDTTCQLTSISSEFVDDTSEAAVCDGRERGTRRDTVEHEPALPSSLCKFTPEFQIRLDGSHGSPFSVLYI